MTTLVALSTKDVIVMGCDSLGTVSRVMINPEDLLQYFDLDRDGKLKTDENGKPLLSNFWEHIYSQKKDIPDSHMTHVDKLFDLDNRVGVMISGIISIGDRTLKSIIQEFTFSPTTILKHFKQAFTTSYSIYDASVHDIAQQLADKIQRYYKQEYPGVYKPEIELLVAGWDPTDNRPKIYRINFPSGSIKLELNGSYGISFGGQYQEIARLVHGTDLQNMNMIEERYASLLRRFVDELKKANQNIILPDLDDFLKKFHIFGLENPDDTSSSQYWRLEGFKTDIGNFSEQNAINCVYWLVELMVRVQEFSDSMPTVGGDIHVAIIDRKKGFKFVSEESYKLQGHITPR